MVLFSSQWSNPSRKILVQTWKLEHYTNFYWLGGFVVHHEQVSANRDILKVKTLITEGNGRGILRYGLLLEKGAILISYCKV